MDRTNSYLSSPLCAHNASKPDSRSTAKQLLYWMENPPASDDTTQLIQYLRTFFREREINGKGLEADDPVAVKARDEIQGVLQTLLREFIEDFPRSGAWSKEIALTSQSSLEVFAQSLLSFDWCYQGVELVEQSWVAQIFKYIGNMERWIQRNPPMSETLNGPTPAYLKDQAVQALCMMLGQLRRDLSSRKAHHQQPWTVAKRLCTELSTSITDIMSAASPSQFSAFQISLFQNPRVNFQVDPFLDGADATFTITKPTDVHSIILDLLQPCISCVPSIPAASDHLFYDIVLQIANTTCNVFHFFMATTSFASDTQKSVVFSKFVEILHPLLVDDRCSALITPNIARLLIQRIKDGPNANWQEVDKHIAQAFQVAKLDPSSAGHLSYVLEAIAVEDWNEPGADELRDACVAYISKGLSHIPLTTAYSFCSAIEKRLPSDHCRTVLADLDRHIAVLSMSSGAPASPSKLKRKRDFENDPMDRIAEIAQRILQGQSNIIDFHDGDHDGYNAEKILGVVEDTLTRSWSNLTPAQKNEALSDLLLLICTMAHPFSLECDTSEPSPLEDQDFFSPFIRFSATILTNYPAQMSVATWKKVLDVVARTLNHVPFNHECKKTIISIIQRSFSHADRSVRLASGKLAASIVQALQHSTPFSVLSIEPVIGLFRKALEGSKIRLQESSIACVGFIGRVANQETLGVVILCLIAQLNQKTSFIQALAYGELLALAKFYDKAPIAFLSPYFKDISCFVVPKIRSAPSYLTEICRFLGRGFPDFLSLTQNHTLPVLVATNNKDALNEVAKHLTRDVGGLIVQWASVILSHLLMLPVPNDTQNGILLIEEVFSGYRKELGFENLLVSHRIEIITELIIAMADEDADTARRATDALRRLERRFSRMQAKPKASTPAVVSLSDFLQPITLGILSQLNTAITTSRAKASVQHRKQIVRSLGALIATIGPSIANISPQILALLHSMINVESLTETTLETWKLFVCTLAFKDVGPHAGPTSAVIVAGWPNFSPTSRYLAKDIVDYILDHGNDLEPYLQDMVTLETIPELQDANRKLNELRKQWTSHQVLDNLLDRSSHDNVSVSVQSLAELKSFMIRYRSAFEKFASGDVFDPIINDIVRALFKSACREGDGCEEIRMKAFDCIGVLGALDPDRFDMTADDSSMMVLYNFSDEGETVMFAIHLIGDLLAGAYRAASDITYQNNLAYAIQELLKFCQFTSDLVVPNSAVSVPSKIRQRWESLPQSVIETVTAFLEGRLTLKGTRGADTIATPIYSSVTTYREWIQRWSQHLISRVTAPNAKRIFSIFQAVVRHQDVLVAHHILPHLVLHLIMSGTDSDRDGIRSEIIMVLEDSINLCKGSSTDRNLLSAQIVFNLMDHVSKWIRLARQAINLKRSRRHAGINSSHPLVEQLMQVDSLMASIDHDLTAQAAFQCKAYARALMNFEQQVMIKRRRGGDEEEIQRCYERIHEIYAHLDEPDGMEGISAMVFSPSLDHQIREHESLGRWTSAQSCWEIKLQNSPDDIDLHIGLLRCLRNLGHYDTLRTHIRGLLSRTPQWGEVLAGFHAEGSYMVGDWGEVENLVKNTQSNSPELNIARLLLALRGNDQEAVAQSVTNARQHLGAPITAGGRHSYRRSYEAVVNLHIVRELELIHEKAGGTANRSQYEDNAPFRRFTSLTTQLASRLNSTLPTFRAREPILSMRRIALAMSFLNYQPGRREVGRSWLETAKIARKAGHSQTAYSAILQAKQLQEPFAVIQSCKLLKAEGDGHRALQELEGFLTRPPTADDGEEAEYSRMMMKILLYRARWMRDAERAGHKEILQAFNTAATTDGMESQFFHLGRYHDELRASSSASPHISFSYAYQTCKNYTHALARGSKYIFQTLPRLLTLWLDIGESEIILSHGQNGTQPNHPEQVKSCIQSHVKINGVIQKAINLLRSYQWFTAFPQIVSRIEHPNKITFDLLAKLTACVLESHPQQALWLFTSVVKSGRTGRRTRGEEIIRKVKSSLSQQSRSSSSSPAYRSNGFMTLVEGWASLSSELLSLCDYKIEQETILSATKFPRMLALMPCELILPLQSSMTVSLPPRDSEESTHQPFPLNLPTIRAFQDEIEIMKSLQKPRKISLLGSDNQVYHFLCKPKDDLRKDARLMDFNAIINKLLTTNSESRRRKLHIRTYSVVPLNEECGLIEWVPNTIGLRFVLQRLLEPRNVSLYPKHLTDEYEKAREGGEARAKKAFVEAVLPLFPPIFHEWFIATFPEPTSWLASRLAYGRTAAVMSMVGYILGLGDRHGENILFDSTNGDAIHVDFNCLFERGKTFAVPERVPFRLTQNMIDGLGVSGVEGVYRIACEVTMQLLRDNKDSLMSVLEAFVHDPLVEWEDERRNQERVARRSIAKKRVDQPSGETVAAQIRAMAQKALKPIERKLMGMESERSTREIKTKNQVEHLINEATDVGNLSMMYFGWASWL